MFAIRAPFSALGGALFSVALFLGLAKLVNVPFAVLEHTFAYPLSPPTVRPDTAPESRRDPKVVRTPPILEPGPPNLVIDTGVDIDPVPYGRPTLETRTQVGTTGFGGVDTDVIPRVRVNPEYPPAAITRSVEGWVRVQFSVTSIGTVRDAVVVDSEPGTVFDEAALKAIARWRYSPRVVNGDAVERVGLQTVIRFELEN